jgi:D-alanine-D-alanine ligase
VSIIKKVLIIFGGNSSEHIISCKSAKSIALNIDKALFNYKLVGIDFSNTWYQYEDDINYIDYHWTYRKIKKVGNIIDYLKEFDVIFPIIHGTNGEDGKLQGLFDMFNIKYVGCDTLTSSILMDKDISKLIFKSLGINQVPSITINDSYDIKSIINNLPFPIIVKPSNGGSSIGINQVYNKKELKKAIKEALKYDSKIIIEKYLKVRELEIAILKTNKETVISKPGEIKSANEFYDYNAKYENNKSYTYIPNDLDDGVLKIINDYCKLLIDKLNIKGLSRIDFFLDKDNNVYLNEINTIPGFTDISMYPKLIENSGIDYKDLITKIINDI